MTFEIKYDMLEKKKKPSRRDEEKDEKEKIVTRVSKVGRVRILNCSKLTTNARDVANENIVFLDSIDI